MRHFTSNDTDQCQSGSSNILTLHIESILDRLGLLSPAHGQHSQQQSGQITLQMKVAGWFLGEINRAGRSRMIIEWLSKWWVRQITHKSVDPGPIKSVIAQPKNKKTGKSFEFIACSVISREEYIVNVTNTSTCIWYVISGVGDKSSALLGGVDCLPSPFERHPVIIDILQRYDSWGDSSLQLKHFLREKH